MAGSDSHGSTNPTVNCVCKESRLCAPYENHPQTISSHPGAKKIMKKLSFMKPVPGAKKVGEPLFLRCTLLWNNQHNQDHTFLTPKCVLVPLVNCSIMPTSPLPQKTTALQVIWQFLVLYISAVTQCALCFLVWLLSLSIIILRSIHVVVYMNHCWLVFHCMLLSTFIYPFTCWWHLHCFQSFGIANKAAMNVCVCVCVCVYIGT